MLSRLPNGDLAQKLSNEVVQLLFYDLPHPPATYMGDQYRFRTADGSNNNVQIPDMGKAGTPYSRSVQAAHPLDRGELPDPELIYKALLKRDKFVPHPAGLSSLMFGFAALVIHSVFRTSFTDGNINETSSYVDLAPLYGNNQQMQDLVRSDPKDGRGTLKPDVFAEDRLLLLPPATAVILVLFNRNHNYIAQKLLEINERGTWVDPATKLTGDDPKIVKKRLAQDEEIFQTARLINCTWFAQVVFSDYFSSILGLVRDGSAWSLNPFAEIRKDDHTMVERGMGNAVSVEFNLLYRWHPTMSLGDVQWTEAVFKKTFGNKPFDQITPEDFGRVMAQIQANDVKSPADWDFGGIVRDKENQGKFADSDLARILKDATSHPASAFKARGSPPVMQVIELMGINLARKWGVCSLNDFRRFLQLKPYDDFEDWNPDPEIANAARKLYGNIENLELYPGLQAEESKPVVPGAGLCPPYTTSRAILADAIALTRGDRFYTQDFTPWNLTTWGFQDCQRDTSNAGFGSMLGRLFLRTLPEHFTDDSVFTWFPLMTPEAMKENLSKLGVSEKYSFERPGVAPKVQVVESFTAIKDILDNNASFTTPYTSRAKDVIESRGFLSSLDDFKTHEADRRLLRAAFADDRTTLQKAEAFYFTKTQELIRAQSYSLSNVEGRAVDIVGEVLNLVPIYFVSQVITGLPIKTKERPHGTYFPREVQQMLRSIFQYVFLESDPAKKMHAEHVASLHATEILGHIKNNIRPVGQSVIMQTISAFFSGSYDEPLDFLQKLAESKKPKEEIANHALSLALIAGVEYSQALVNVVNFYLDKDNAEHARNISSIAKSNDPTADAVLQAYVREALRLDPSLRGVYRTTKVSYNKNGVKLSKDQPVFLSLAKANLDPNVFARPTEVDISRPAEGYLALNDVVYGILGHEFVEKTMAQVLKAIFSLKNVRRGPGVSGTLRRVVTQSNGTTVYKYMNAQRELSPWAKSMVIQYDG
ncbi:hypothetical protein M422DRAFT_152180 [Sphaerobolus stellatus SS14]|nr:hypothetical protein M422DRAFT_152180 [Sphaerobolus stellatus SS14]